MKTQTDLEMIRERIQAHIESGGPYVHNIISSLLRSCATKYGKKQANKLVDEFMLKILYGIEKVKL